MVKSRFKIKSYSENRKRTAKYFLFVLVVISFLVSWIFLVVQTVSAGSEMSNIEEQEKELIKESKLLKDQIISEDSLSKASTRRNEMGFADMRNFVYLRKEHSVAKLPF